MTFRLFDDWLEKEKEKKVASQPALRRDLTVASRKREKSKSRSLARPRDSPWTFRLARDCSSARLFWLAFFGAALCGRRFSRIFFFFLFFLASLSVPSTNLTGRVSAALLPGRVRVLDRKASSPSAPACSPARQLDPIPDPPQIPFNSPFSRPHFSAPFFFAFIMK